jgi:hypothetical protein
MYIPEIPCQMSSAVRGYNDITHEAKIRTINHWTMVVGRMQDADNSDTLIL